MAEGAKKNSLFLYGRPLREGSENKEVSINELSVSDLVGVGNVSTLFNYRFPDYTHLKPKNDNFLRLINFFGLLSLPSPKYHSK